MIGRSVSHCDKAKRIVGEGELAWLGSVGAEPPSSVHGLGVHK